MRAVSKYYYRCFYDHLQKKDRIIGNQPIKQPSRRETLPKRWLFHALAGREECDLEIKINKEIRDYTESVFFGLSPRQFIFSLAAVGVAVGLFFLLRKHFGMETVSWMCILGAAPFAAIGFIRYHGMSAEQFLWAWIRSELLEPKRLTASRTGNLYYDIPKESIEKRMETITT